MIAAQDRLFLQHDLHLVRFTESIKVLDENLLCLTGALFGRLQYRLGSHAVRKSSGLAEKSLSGELVCDESVANFHHLLRSLQKNVLEATIRHLLRIIEAHNLHSHLSWQYSQRIGEEWFAEWPNGHRPLSTTWPWNIEPSLLVLWGVCWMFYGPSGNNTKGRPTRNPRGAAPLSEDLRTGQPSQQQGKSSRQQSHDQLYFTDSLWIDLSEVWAGPASNTYSNYSWLHPTPTGVARRASDGESYAQSWDQNAYD